MGEPASPTMRAWTHHGAGVPAKVLALRNDVPRPVSLPSPGHVVVRVSYAALNPAGSIMMQLCPSFLRTQPSIPELDFAGHLELVGDGVPLSRALTPGVAVFGSVPVPDHLKGHGALAEYVLVHADQVVRAPPGLDLKHAAGLPVAGCTALALVDAARRRPGPRVLVNGATGGIGSMAVQMMRAATGPDGYIVAVCSREKEALITDLGANEVIDYRAHSPVHEHLTTTFSGDPFDLVLDAYGVQSLFDHCPGFLRPDGWFVTVGVAFDHYGYGSMMTAVSRMMKNLLWPRLLGGTPRMYAQVSSVSNLDGMERLRAYCEDGALRVPIDSCWEMADVLQAYDRMLSRRAKGKIIVQVRPDGA